MKTLEEKIIADLKKKFVVRSYGIDNKTYSEVIGKIEDNRIYFVRFNGIKSFLRQELLSYRREIGQDLKLKIRKHFVTTDYDFILNDIFYIIDKLKIKTNQ